MAAAALHVPATASARFPAVPNPLVAELADPAAVLGLEGADDAASKSLTDALRRAFARRGLGGSEELSLAEVRLAMGCQGDDPACLSEAGRSIGVQKLIYGELQPGSGGDYLLELHILDVEQAVEEAQTTRPVRASQLSEANIDATATEIVNSLFPEEADGELPVAPVTEPVAEDQTEPVQVDQPRRESKLVWGSYKPRPTWKWAGFGVGLGLTVVGAAGAIGTFAALNGKLREDVFDAAYASLEDCLAEGPDGRPVSVPCRAGEEDLNTANDVDPDVVDDVCLAASQRPPGAPEGTVTNKSVYDACQKADQVEIINRASFGVLAGGLLLTAVFTTLLFVRKRQPGENALRRRDLQLSATPTPDGGFMFGGGMKF